MTEQQIQSVDAAVAAYRTLLLQQIDRAERLAAEAKGSRVETERSITVIGLIPGDGIGPIIMKPARYALETLLRDQIADGSVVLRNIEGLTLENRLACGQSVPEDTLAAIRACDLILKGPTTTPHGGTMESANVTLRRELDLFANVRPVSVPELGIDWTFFRENTEGEYILGSRGVAVPDVLTCDFKVTTVEGTRRIARAAFDFAKNNSKQTVTVVTKANIMKKTDGMFSQICHEIADEYPEITCEDRYVDITAAEMINPEMQSHFQVFVSPNLYGDILTDEAAQIMGGVGTAGSANIGSKCAVFEAIHGSAPRMLEQGLGDYASPASILRAEQLLLTHAGFTAQAALLGKAVDAALEAVPVTGTRSGHTCAEFEAFVLSLLNR